MKVSRNRIIYSHTSSDVFGHFLLEVITMMSSKNVELPNPEEYDVTLTVNGVEVEVEEVIMYWYDKLDTCVDRRANEMFAKKFRNVSGILEDFADTIKEEMDDAKRKICDRLNIDYVYED